MNKQSLQARFFSKVQIDEDMGCHNWIGTVDRSGYGRIHMHGRSREAHRVSWYLSKGEFPVLCVCHRCDNRLCVNIDHLFLGTRADNRLDCVSKGRHAKGPTHKFKLHPETIPRGSAAPNAKLTEQQVIEIKQKRALGRTLVSLGIEYGVTFGLIGHICSDRAWKHV